MRVIFSDCVLPVHVNEVVPRVALPVLGVMVQFDEVGALPFANVYTTLVIARLLP